MREKAASLSSSSSSCNTSHSATIHPSSPHRLVKIGKKLQIPRRSAQSQSPQIHIDRQSLFNFMAHKTYIPSRIRIYISTLVSFYREKAFSYHRERTNIPPRRKTPSHCPRLAFIVASVNSEAPRTTRVYTTYKYIHTVCVVRVGAATRIYIRTRARVRNVSIVDLYAVV